MRLLLLFFLTLLLFTSSCTPTTEQTTVATVSEDTIPSIKDSTQSSPIETKASEPPSYYQHFLAGFQQEQATIPDSLAYIYVEDALADVYAFPYSDIFSYTYGKIVFENDTFVAVTFNAEGDNGMSILDGDFMLTINKQDGGSIDAVQVGAASDYEWHFSRGYNMMYNMDYTIQTDSLGTKRAFRVDCNVSKNFYNFNEDMIEDPKDRQERTEKETFYFTVNNMGYFSDKKQ